MAIRRMRRPQTTAGEGLRHEKPKIQKHRQGPYRRNLTTHSFFFLWDECRDISAVTYRIGQVSHLCRTTVVGIQAMWKRVEACNTPSSSAHFSSLRFGYGRKKRSAGGDRNAATRAFPKRRTFRSSALGRQFRSTNVKQEIRRQHRPVKPSAAYEPFPFEEGEYQEVVIRLVQASSDGTSQGSILLLRKQDINSSAQTSVLVIGIGGDALIALVTILQGRDSIRPLALDLLWQVLLRGKEISTQQWELEKVAIVRLEGGIYYGRLFFGSKESGTIWDCDCRPSDAMWLASRQNCPIFVHKDVWEEASAPIDSVVEVEDPSSVLEGVDSQEVVDPLRAIVHGDPEPIKRLKRELGVAITEEDYESAARIRDHPYMKIYANMVEAGREGNHNEKARLEKELLNLISQQEGLSS